MWNQDAGLPSPSQWPTSLMRTGGPLPPWFGYLTAEFAAGAGVPASVGRRFGMVESFQQLPSSSSPGEGECPRTLLRRARDRQAIPPAGDGEASPTDNGAREFPCALRGPQLLSMSFAEIHAALAEDPPGDDRFAAAGTPIVLRSALTLLTQIIGLPLLAIDLPPPRLAIRFPKNRLPEEVVPQFGRELPRYLAWRRIVLDLQLLATREPVDADPWDTLRRLTRLTLGPLESDALYALECRMDGHAPAALTRAQALALQDRLSGHSRLGFRRACRVLDQLHAHELAEALGILPPIIGALPERARIREHLALPPGLAAFAAEHGATSPLAHCWTLAVKAGLFQADADPDPASAFPPALWKALTAADPRAHGVDLQPGTMKSYRERA